MWGGRRSSFFFSKKNWGYHTSYMYHNLYNFEIMKLGIMKLGMPFWCIFFFVCYSFYSVFCLLFFLRLLFNMLCFFCFVCGHRSPPRPLSDGSSGCSWRESALACLYLSLSPYARKRTLAYVTTYGTAYVSILHHTSAYVSIRQQTLAYVRIRQHTSECLN